MTEELLIDTSEVTTSTAAKEETAPILDTTKEVKSLEDFQLEPTLEELESERLNARAEQLQDEIAQLRDQLVEKEEELVQVKEALGITAFGEFKTSVAHGFKVVGDKIKGVQDTETYKLIDNTFVGWKAKVEDSDSYQKTKTTLSAGGKKVQDSFQAAGTKIKENETLKNIGGKTTDAFHTAGTKIKDAGTAIRESETLKNVGTKITSAASTLKEKVWVSTDKNDGTDVPAGETVVPDEPPKSE